VTLQVLVYQVWKTQPYHDFEQKRKVVNPFCGYSDLRVHALRISGNSRFRQNFQRKVSYHDTSDIIIFIVTLAVNLHSIIRRFTKNLRETPSTSWWGGIHVAGDYPQAANFCPADKSDINVVLRCAIFMSLCNVKSKRG